MVFLCWFITPWGKRHRLLLTNTRNNYLGEEGSERTENNTNCRVNATSAGLEPKTTLSSIATFPN